MVRIKHPGRLAGFAAVAAFLLYGAWYSWGPRRTPNGQRALAQLDAATLPGFEAQFNAQAGHPRVLLLLSPT